MNILKLSKIIFVIVVYCTTLLSAQNLLRQAPHKITKRDISSQEYKPVETSRKNYVLLEKVVGDIREYYLADRQNGFDFTAAKKEKLFSFHKDDRVQFVQFSKSGEQVVFRREKNEKKVWEIHDINSNKTKIIESDEGSVDVASFYNMNNILYRVYLTNDRPRIYLIKENKQPVFVDNGFGIQWSNNMNYFLLESYLTNELSLFEKRRYGKISNEEYSRQLKAQGGSKREIFSRYVIYNSDGERLLILRDFDLVDWIQWSPDSNKILLRERGDPGFKIIYLNYITERNIEIENIYHFPGFSKFEREISTFCLLPSWSPDGNRILFMTEVEDGHAVLYNNAYILEDQSYQYYPVIELSDVFISNLKWLSDQSVFLEARDINTRENYTYRIAID